MKERYCMTCGEKINFFRGGKYCSDKCRKKCTKKYKKKPPITKKCRYCKKEFTTSHPNRVYCSKECAETGNEIFLKKHGRFIIFERDDFTCFYCGRKPYTDWVELHCDHVKPKSIGGESKAYNLVTTCKRCNLEKHARAIKNTDQIYDEVKRRNKKRGIKQQLQIKWVGDPNGKTQKKA